MKLIAATLVLAVAAASPALAQTKKKQNNKQQNYQSWQWSNPTQQQKRRPRSPTPQWDVYWMNGEYSGTDPDPRIRMMLFYDDPTNGDS